MSPQPCSQLGDAARMFSGGRGSSVVLVGIVRYWGPLRVSALIAPCFMIWFPAPRWIAKSRTGLGPSVAGPFGLTAPDHGGRPSSCFLQGKTCLPPRAGRRAPSLFPVWLPIISVIPAFSPLRLFQSLVRIVHQARQSIPAKLYLRPTGPCCRLQTRRSGSCWCLAMSFTWPVVRRDAWPVLVLGPRSTRPAWGLGCSVRPISPTKPRLDERG